MKLLTIFTPAYNRLHTIRRTFESLNRQTCDNFEWIIIDDGSEDGIRIWVESLGEKIVTNGQRFDWMGIPLDGVDENHFVIQLPKFKLTYIYKPNGGLYTGYNVAFSIIKTELCVCIDSDDYLPDDAVENICKGWESLSIQEKRLIGGIVGLDYDVVNGKPLGGFFPVDNQIEWIQNLHHLADSKFVFRTSEIKRYAPQIGFCGEKDFNPHYMQMQLFDKFPMLVLNKNLCWVEYQIGADSMSRAIFKQYKRSPRSYAKYRLMELSMHRGLSLKRRISLAAHYFSACMFSRDINWLKNTPFKFLTIISIPIGIIYYCVIQYKASKE